MKKILFVVNDFPNLTETFIVNKVVNLSKKSYSTYVLRHSSGRTLQSIDGEFSNILILDSLLVDFNFIKILSSIIRKPFKSLLFLANKIRSGKSIYSSLRLLLKVLPILRVSPDIVHFEFSGIAVSYIEILDDLKGVKIVVSCRNSAEQIKPILDSNRATSLAKVFNRADAVHCVSRYIEKICKGYGLDTHKSFINYPSADIRYLRYNKSIQYNNKQKDAVVISLIGRLHWVKGIEIALAALGNSTMISSIERVNIVGDGPEYDKIKFMVHDLALDDVVVFHGHLQKSHVRDILTETDILLLPSIMEGISNSAIEAMAMGKIVISSDTCGMPELISHGQNGFLFSKYNSHDLTLLIDKTVANYSKMEDVRRNAAKTIEKSFCLDNQIDKFEEVYNKIVD